jgi:enamine deaminase RidA (YjgF/YER057c/UK114 family)
MNIKRLGDPSEISDAVIVGNMVYLAGVVPEDPVPASVYEQARNVLKQIDEVLAQAGTDKTRLVKAQVFLADIKTFDEMHRAWKEWVPKGHAPARATVEARLVHHPKWGIEIMCEAALP